jgi:hypothetical protein
MEGPSCTGCNQIIEEGSVIAFGDSLFHLKWYCFALCLQKKKRLDCNKSFSIVSYALNVLILLIVNLICYY